MLPCAAVSRPPRFPLLLVLLAFGCWAEIASAANEPEAITAALDRSGLATTPGFFPIGVWLQPPARATRYRDAGINLYVGLWRGPTEEQLATLRQAGMRVICEQNELALRHREDPIIAAWMHGDEPDNAQSLGSGGGYGPPIPPAQIIAGYQRLRERDPSRPVLLNLGQGVAWDDWHGRGVRTRHPEDYLEYVKGADIASFDIYPVTHDRPAVSSNLWFVARGVERLVGWMGGTKPVWNCIECTRISHPTAKPTPHQVRAEVWMSLIHGSRGLIYFVHEWKPKFNESALLDDPEMLAAVTRLNRQILELAPVLNAPPVPGLVNVTSGTEDVPVAVLAKRHAGAVYVFAVAMRDGNTRTRFQLAGTTGAGPVKVLGEDRVLPLNAGVFEDSFGGWEVHLYQVNAP